MLAREREWHELPQFLPEAQKRRSDLGAEFQTEEANQRRLLEKLAMLDKTRDEIKAQEGSRLEKLTSQQRQAELLDQEMGWRRAIEDQLKDETRALDEKEALFTEELGGLKEEEAKTQQRILILKAQLNALSVEKLEDRLAKLKTAVAVAEQACENQRTVLQNLKASSIHSDEQVSAKKEKKELLTAESLHLVGRIEDLRLGSRELMHQVQAVAQLVEPTDAELATLENEQVEMEKTEASLRPLLREYESLHGQAMLKVERRKDELTSLLHQIENDLGRVRNSDKYGPRPIDIDIMFFNQQIFEMDNHHIPDPEVLERPFVAIPLAEIAPDYEHPETGQTLRDIAQGFEVIEEDR